MEEEESNDEYDVALRRKLRDIFGTFDEFNERINRSSIKHGVVRAKIRGKVSPSTVVSSSPNHVPVFMALQSMRNLADEPLDNLPTELPSLKAAMNRKGHSTTPSSSSSTSAAFVNKESAEEQKMDFKKRKRKEIDDHQAAENAVELDNERKKKSRFDDRITTGDEMKQGGGGGGGGDSNQNIAKTSSDRREKDNSSVALSPDSGVHSTENDIGDDNQSVEEMLNIMTSLEKPKLSPIPDDWLLKFKQKDQEKKEEKERKRKMADERNKKEKENENDERKAKKGEKSTFSAVFNDESSSDESSANSKNSPIRSSISPLQPPTLVRKTVPIPPAKITSSIPSTSNNIHYGEIRLNALKAEKLQKLLSLAKRNGCLIQNGGDPSIREKNRKRERGDEEAERKRKKHEEKRSERDRGEERNEKRRKEKERPSSSSSRESDGRIEKNPDEITITNKKVQKLAENSWSTPTTSAQSPKISLRPPAGGPSLTPKSLAASAKNTPTAAAASSRPSSSMSASHEINSVFSNAISSTLSTSAALVNNRSQNATPRIDRPDSSASSTNKTTPPSGGSAGSVTSWKCSWKNCRLTNPKRVPIPDPTQPNQKSKKDFYHDLAKEFKSKADSNKDRVRRALDYMMASVYFVLEAITLIEHERTAQSISMGQSIYKDSQELLKVVLMQAMRDSDDPLVMHLLPRVKILGQTMLAIMHYQIYLLRCDQVLKTAIRLESNDLIETIDVNTTNGISSSASTSSAQSANQAPTNKILAQVGGSGSGVGSGGGGGGGGESAGSTPRNGQSSWLSTLLTNSNDGMTMMPTVVYQLHRQQLKMVNFLVMAQRYWQDSKTLAHKVDLEFLKSVETVCGKTLSLDSSFETSVPIILTAIASLKLEYDEERKSSSRPIAAKVKPLLDTALKTGQFYSVTSDRAHQRAQNTSTTTQK